MKALLRQTAILALAALVLSQADQALAHTANGRTDIPVCLGASVLVTHGRTDIPVCPLANGRTDLPVCLPANARTDIPVCPSANGSIRVRPRVSVLLKNGDRQECLSYAQSSSSEQARPLPAPLRWRGLIGEYDLDNGILYILEKDGKLCALFKRAELEQLEEVSKNVFKFPAPGSRAGQRLLFTRDAKGRATQVEAGSVVYKRRQVGPEAGATQLRVKPLRPVSELLKEALAAAPPPESGELWAPDLVELTKLDPSIKLEIRYATTNNLFGTVFYSEARAFLQRPAAESLVRVNRKLRQMGYGLLVHDAYRPWYVTRVFWDATPDDKKLFVADPSKGSRHNRGCAVDLTLYDLKTRKPVEMVSTYDETTDRAYPDYPGGTSLQRWQRNLLRTAMESEGFTVYEAEWWHFDYKDWQKYPIGNSRFDQISTNRN